MTQSAVGALALRFEFAGWQINIRQNGIVAVTHTVPMP
jgi:hypothetical protein